MGEVGCVQDARAATFNEQVLRDWQLRYVQRHGAVRQLLPRNAEDVAAVAPAPHLAIDEQGTGALVASVDFLRRQREVNDERIVAQQRKVGLPELAKLVAAEAVDLRAVEQVADDIVVCFAGNHPTRSGVQRRHVDLEPAPVEE